VTDPRPDEVALEAQVGHPGERWQRLRDRVQDEAITRFSEIEGDWLDLMWALDAFRAAGITPRKMGRNEVKDPSLLRGAIYRQKGNWFATLIALLLQNQTHQQISPRTRVRGFSQNHQIDVAWPVRQEDPLICVETKVSGAPPIGDGNARGSLDDFSNRRKELKFAATDLKLNRRQQETVIEHWGAWREKAPPQAYFLWAARLRTEPRKTGRAPKPGALPKVELVERLVVEADALRTSYLDGTGLIAWRRRADGSGYEKVPVPERSKVTELDDALYRIASEIKGLVGPGGRPPAPERPAKRDVDVDQLVDDKKGSSTTTAGDPMPSDPA
jgi:hypothetical protein